MFKMTIRSKLMAFVALSAVGTVSSAAGLVWLLLASQASSDKRVAALETHSYAAQGMAASAARLHGVTLSLLREKDRGILEERIKEADSAARDARGRVRGKVALESALATLSASNAKATEALRRGEVTKANEVFLAQSSPAFETFLAAIETSQSDALKELKSARTGAHRRMRAIAVGACLGVVVLVGALALVGFLTACSVTSGLARIVARVRDVAEGEGDLTRRLEAGRGDELGELARWINQFVENIQNLVRQSADATVEMASAAEELSASTSQIAAGNRQISAQSQSLATAAEQMTATVDQVARNVQEVSSASEQANHVAGEGASIVSEALGAIDEIAGVVRKAAGIIATLGTEAEKVGSVVDVIEDIADQTNLLALNAAIEAARAGEHGRGFAVVADEVRKLAKKTVKATQEISHTVSSIQSESRVAVEAVSQGQKAAAKGTELGRKAGEAIHAIETQVKRASEETQQIAAAVQQLNATIHNVALNIDEIAHGIEQNAVAGGEIARTAESVAGKADEIKSATGCFRT